MKLFLSLLFSLTLAATSQLGAKEIYAKLMGPLKQSFHDFPLNPEIDLDLDDIWFNILGQIGRPLDLWNMGMTCKRFGHMIRNSSFQHENPSADYLDQFVSEIIVNSDLSVLPYMLPYFRKAHFDLYKVVPKLACEVLYSTWQSIYQKCYNRAENWEVIKFAAENIGDSTHFVSPEFAVNSYSKGTLSIFVPPPGTTEKLFETIPPKNVLALLAAHNNYGKPETFLVPLIHDYILPYWDRLTGRIPDDIPGLELIRYITKIYPRMFQPYFKHVFWALFFFTGSVRRDGGSVAQRLSNFLKHFGIGWCCDTFGVQPAPKNIEDLTKLGGKRPSSSHPAVLLAAKQWGFLPDNTFGSEGKHIADDIHRIIHGTPIPAWLNRSNPLKTNLFEEEGAFFEDQGPLKLPRTADSDVAAARAAYRRDLLNMCANRHGADPSGL